MESRRALKCWRLLPVLSATALGLSSCAASHSLEERHVTSAQVGANSSPTQSTGIAADEGIAKGLSGIMLSNAAFANSVVGKSFQYREVGSDLVLRFPGEYYFEDGRYAAGHRAFSQGTYSFDKGLLSIKCDDCHASYMGLGPERVFFRRGTSLLMANADGHGSAVELIEQP